MQAGRLQCPSCGVPVSAESPKCEHCGTRLATVACPGCFAMVFKGATFCAHCGEILQRADGTKTSLPCPKCKPKPLGALKLGHTPVHECGGCHGLWVEAAVFDQICIDRERQSAVLGSASETFRPGDKKFSPQIRYVPCPVCGQLMHRLNFAKCSGVVVDVCRGHGTWFDCDELQHIVQFIRAGGIDRSREKEKAELEAVRRRLQADRSAAAQEAARGHVHRTTFGEPDLWAVVGSIISEALD